MKHRGTGERWLGYIPGLDGVRAFAVLGVMMYHYGLAAMPGGFAGVDAFFVLSGFLITSLLLGEHGVTGRITLGTFWARRARRLLPALVVLIIVVTLYVRFVLGPQAYPGLRADAFSSLFYFANWHFIFSGSSYFAQSQQVSPLLHTWSLAIEEQFYIVWPIVVVVVTRVARTLWPLLWISVVGAVASAVEMGILYQPSNPTRVYFGTDTHAQSLLVGTALATGFALWRRAGDRRIAVGWQRAFSTLGIAGFAFCACSWSHVGYNDSAVFHGGFLVVSLSVAAVISSVVLAPKGPITRVLSFAPLRYIGRISYGMYLWHFPIRIALDTATTGLGGWQLLLSRTALTIVVSSISYRLIELPIRTSQWFTWRRIGAAIPFATAGVVAVIVLGTMIPPVSSAPPIHPLADANEGLAAVPVAYADTPVRVLIVGDSVALTLGSLEFSQNQYHLSIADEGTPECGVVEVTTYWGVDQAGQYEKLQTDGPCSPDPSKASCSFPNWPLTKFVPCLPWPVAWHNWLTEVKPNVVVFLAGRWETRDELYHGKRTNVTHPAYAAYVKRQLQKAVQIGTSTGARMILMTAPCFSAGEQPNGAAWPDDSSRRLNIYNGLLRKVAAEDPGNVTVQNLDAMVCPGGTYVSSMNGVPLRSDGVHFVWPYRGEGADYLAPEILPLWQDLGHEQEVAAGGRTILPGRVPPSSDLSPG
jgi:peptidoglycan/LPS O-acetylase OafA/YrhL